MPKPKNQQGGGPVQNTTPTTTVNNATGDPSLNGSASTGYTFTPPALPPPPGAPNISAQEDPTLQAIDQQYAKYAEDLQNNTGRILNQATSATRDAFAGLRQQTGEDFAMRGVGGGEALRDVDSSTGRAIASQHAQIARNREEQLRGALDARNAARQGAIGAMQGEKRIGLDAYGAQNQAMGEYNRLAAQNAATAFDQMMALKNFERQGQMISAGGGGEQSGGYGDPAISGPGGAGGAFSMTPAMMGGMRRSSRFPSMGL